jgi:hypothetical protein
MKVIPYFPCCFRGQTFCVVSEVEPLCFRGQTSCVISETSMFPRSNLMCCFRGRTSMFLRHHTAIFHLLRPQQRTSTSGGIVDQRHYHSNTPLSTRSSELPQVRSSLINSTTTATFHHYNTDSDLQTTTTLDRALGLWVQTAGDPVVPCAPPLSVVQMVIFPNVIEV